MNRKCVFEKFQGAELKERLVRKSLRRKVANDQYLILEKDGDREKDIESQRDSNPRPPDFLLPRLYQCATIASQEEKNLGHISKDRQYGD